MVLIDVLSGCRKALGGGRYKYRHDAVLRVLAHSVQLALNTTKYVEAKLRGITFVKAGAKITNRQKTVVTGLIHMARDWVLTVDLETKLVFPIVDTELRPDMVIVSYLKQIVND